MGTHGRIKQWVTMMAGGAVIAAVLLSTGCAERRYRVYDPYHRDYHRFDNGEVVIYRGYLNDRHEPYREFRHLNHEQQKAYWDWRHDHDHH